MTATTNKVRTNVYLDATTKEKAQLNPTNSAKLFLYISLLLNSTTKK